MSAATPEQAAARAFVTGCVARGLTASQASVPPEGQLSTVRGLWADVAQAVVDAATEGSLRACGYTLADVGRFLEAEAAAQEPHAADELAAVLADRHELSGLNAWQGAEIGRLRDALEQVAKHASRDHCTCSVVAGIAKRALEGE